MVQSVWVEVPVKDIERALKFYQAVFELPTHEITDDGVRKTVTLSGEYAVGFSLNQTKNFEPGNRGALVYLDTGKDLSVHLARVVPAGGKVIDPKTSMGSAGWYASFEDTEGNLFAFYSTE